MKKSQQFKKFDVFFTLEKRAHRVKVSQDLGT
jgi:hypothetical protein